MSWPGIIFTFSLAEHVLFARMLGLDPGTASGLHPKRAAAAGIACALLAAASASAAWAIREYVLDPLGIPWLQTAIIILATVGIASLARLALGRAAPRSADLFGPVLRPSGATVAALGTVLVAARAGFGIVESIVAGLASGAGLLVALAILAGVADRLVPGERPSPMTGLPRALVSAGLAALAFTAFDRALFAGLTG